MAFWVGRRAFVLGAAAGLAGCDRTGPMPEGFAIPWREVTGEAGRSYRLYNTHETMDGVALSPDGALFAVTLAGAAGAELTLIDLKAGAARGAGRARAGPAPVPACLQSRREEPGRGPRRAAHLPGSRRTGDRRPGER